MSFKENAHTALPDMLFGGVVNVPYISCAVTSPYCPSISSVVDSKQQRQTQISQRKLFSFYFLFNFFLFFIFIMKSNNDNRKRKKKEVSVNYDLQKYFQKYSVKGSFLISLFLFFPFFVLFWHKSNFVD